MTRKIQFDIEAENKTDQAFDQAISNIMKTSDLSEDSKKVMEDLARQYMSTIQEFQNGNMTYEQTAVKMMELETQMVSVRDSAEKQKLTFTELNNIMEVGQKIIGAVKQIYAATIQPVLDYANTTQQLSGSLRITSEEASTLIGVFTLRPFTIRNNLGHERGRQERIPANDCRTGRPGRQSRRSPGPDGTGDNVV